MSINETNALEPEQSVENNEEADLVILLYNLALETLKEQFPEHEVDGQVGRHPIHGPMLAFTLKEADSLYTCGFFLSELVRQFQSNPHVIMWLSSFFIDMLDHPGGKLLPNPPQNEEDAKHLFDNHIIPHCSQAIREEFNPEPVQVEFGVHPEHGPVLEFSFTNIIEGNNTCAMPLHYLLTLYLMNRDPTDPISQALTQLMAAHEEALK